MYFIKTTEAFSFSYPNHISLAANDNLVWMFFPATRLQKSIIRASLKQQPYSFRYPGHYLSFSDDPCD